MLVDLRYAQKQLGFVRASIARLDLYSASDALTRATDALARVLEAAPGLELKARCECSALPCICRPEEWTVEEVLRREG